MIIQYTRLYRLYGCPLIAEEDEDEENEGS